MDPGLAGRVALVTGAASDIGHEISRLVVTDVRYDVIHACRPGLATCAVQPYPDELPYRAAKSTILSLSKGLSKTYANQGVLVNPVSPASIATPMTDAMMEKRASENGTSMELARRGEAHEVAATIVFLFVNGANCASMAVR